MIEDLLQKLLDNSPDFLFFKDRESRFIMTNKAHARLLLGLAEPEEAVGKTDFDLFPGKEKDTQRFYEEEQEIMRTGKGVFGREWQVPNPATGEIMWLEEHKLPLRDETGEIVGLLGLGRDATRRKQAELDRERLIHQLQTVVDEVESTVRQTTEQADKVAEASRRSVEISELGAQAVRESIDGMKVIRTRVEGIAESILGLSERMQQIGQIIARLDGIAKQSKLLALNATIEAVRAGEDGKGFSVVALEVKELAEQSREATEQVRQILNDIQQATNTTVSATEEGGKGVDTGMARVEQAGQVIDDLAKVISDAAQVTSQIATLLPTASSMSRKTWERLHP